MSTSADDSDLKTGEELLDWAVRSRATERIDQRSRAVRRRRRSVRLTAVATIALATTCVIWSWRRPMEVPASSSAIVSAPATQILSDGTLVDLKDGAQVRAEFTASVRQVKLLQGEAHFRVTPAPARPFVVVANDVEIRAIGTAFSVQVGPDAIDVLVTEGTVQVTTAAAAPALVQAGHRVSLSTLVVAKAVAPVVEPVTTDYASDRLAWRVPRIDFSGTPLSEAIPLFNRYSSVHLVLADPSLGSIQLSGVLRPENPDSLLRVLKADSGIEAEHRGSEIILRRR